MADFEEDVRETDLLENEQRYVSIINQFRSPTINQERCQEATTSDDAGDSSRTLESNAKSGRDLARLSNILFFPGGSLTFSFSEWPNTTLKRIVEAKRMIKKAGRDCGQRSVAKMTKLEEDVRERDRVENGTEMIFEKKNMKICEVSEM